MMAKSHRLLPLMLLTFGMPLLLWADGTAARVSLPEARTDGERSLEKTIVARRSVRAFSAEALTWEQVGQLCWSAQGLTDPGGRLRAAPSAGATFPLELYVATGQGLYRYVVGEHELERLIEGDIRPALRRAALDQATVEAAPAVFIMAAEIARTAGRYGERAERFVLMEVGHAAQNLLLQAAALDLAAVPVGAFDDAGIARVLKLPEGQQPFYLIPVGHAVRDDAR